MMQQDDSRQPTSAPDAAAPEPGTAAAVADLTAAQLAAAGQPSADQPTVSPSPSPYLDAGESVPQAYLAPPRPGQPRYGTAPGHRQFGVGQRPSAQQGYGQPGYGQQPGSSQQPGSGQPRFGRPAGLSARAARDPALAGTWERLAASILDWVIIVAASIAAFLSPLLHIWRELEVVANRYQNLSSPTAQAALNDVARSQSNQKTLLYFFLALFAIALAYYWVQHAAWGATIGKRVLGTRVVAATDRSPIGARAAGIRALAFLIGPVVFLLVPSPLNVLGGVLWIADAALPLFDARCQSLHDKLAGTIVVSQRRLDQQRGPAPSRW
jgi:uncharacterized RDD family membrane protein YckC